MLLFFCVVLLEFALFYYVNANYGSVFAVIFATVNCIIGSWIAGDSAPENHSNNGNKASMKFIQSAGEVSKIYLLIQMKLTAKIYRNLQTKPSKTLLYPVLIFIEILL